MKLRLAFISACCFVWLSAFAAASGDASWKARPGPWGDLEVRTVYLEAPDALLAAVAKPNAITRWVFEQMSESGVRDLLQLLVS